MKMNKIKQELKLSKYLFLLTMFLLGVAVQATDDIANLDEQELQRILKQEKHEILDNVRAQILKEDRFLIWKQNVAGKEYVFKKRLEGPSQYEEAGVIFSDRHNIKRFEQAKKVIAYIGNKNLKHIKVTSSCS